MSFDCYCVLCGGPLRLGVVTFGSGHPKALRTRRKNVANGITEDQSDQGTEDETQKDKEDAHAPLDQEAQLKAYIAASSKKYIFPVLAHEANWGEDAASDLDCDLASGSSDHSSDSQSDASTGSGDDLADITDVPLRPTTPDSRNPDCWSESSEISIWEDFNLYRGSRGSFDPYHEQHSYGPDEPWPEDFVW